MNSMASPVHRGQHVEADDLEGYEAEQRGTRVPAQVDGADLRIAELARQ
jgi:hypothetical protein